jgi:hypothetical protein
MIMVALVIVMTIMDMLHKKSAKFFFESANKAKADAVNELSAGDKIGIATPIASIIAPTCHTCVHIASAPLALKIMTAVAALNKMKPYIVNNIQIVI